MFRLLQFVFYTLLFLVSGCQLTPTFTTGYKTTMIHPEKAPIFTSLAVTSFDEARPPRIYSTQGKIFCYRKNFWSGSSVG